MAYNWDWLIGGSIIVGLILVILARLNGQTIVEFIRDVVDYLREVKEDRVDSPAIEING